MEHNTNKEKWINEIMGSTAGMQRAKPKEGLYDRVMSRLGDEPTVRTIPLNVKRWAAAAVLLVALNAVSVVYFTQNRKVASDLAESTQTLDIPSVSTYNY